MKPGYRTTEFWLTVVALTLTNLGTIDVPEKYRWVVTALGVAGYAISRGLAKYESPPPSGEVFGVDLPEEEVDPVAAEEADQQRVVSEVTKTSRSRKARKGRNS